MVGSPEKSDHVGSGLRVCRFGVTPTPVGRFANGSKGIPVLHTDTAADSEVIRITDDRFGTQRPSLLEIRQEPRRLVVTAQRGIHAPANHSGTKGPGSTHPSMK